MDTIEKPIIEIQKFIQDYQKNLAAKRIYYPIFQIISASYETFMFLGTIYDMKNIYQPLMFLSVWGLLLTIAFQLLSVYEQISIKFFNKPKPNQKLGRYSSSHLTHCLFIAAFSFQIVNTFMYWVIVYPAILNWRKGQQLELQTSGALPQGASLYGPSLATEISRQCQSFFQLSFSNYFLHFGVYFILWIDFLLGAIKFHNVYLIPTILFAAAYCLVNFLYTKIIMPVYPNIRWETKSDSVFVLMSFMILLLHFWFGKFVSRTIKSNREMIYVDEQLAEQLKKKDQ